MLCDLFNTFCCVLLCNVKCAVFFFRINSPICYKFCPKFMWLVSEVKSSYCTATSTAMHPLRLYSWRCCTRKKNNKRSWLLFKCLFLLILEKVKTAIITGTLFFFFFANCQDRNWITFQNGRASFGMDLRDLVLFRNCVVSFRSTLCTFQTNMFHSFILHSLTDDIHTLFIVIVSRNF